MSDVILPSTAFSAGTLRTGLVHMSLKEPRSLSVQFNWDSTLTCSSHLVEVSNDPALHSLVASGGDPDTAEWIDYTAGTTMVNLPAGTAGNGGINVSFFGYEWVRFGLVWSAGSSNVTAWAHGIK